MSSIALGLSRVRSPFVTAAGLGILCLWSYWPTLRAVAGAWSNDPQYSHGYLVPVFAAYLLWSRRQRLLPESPAFHWGGVFALGAGAGLRLMGAYFYLPWCDAISLLPCLAGLSLMLGGRSALRWSWPAIAFLFFMVPLPFRLQVAMGAVLQRVATGASTYVLQTCGFLARSEGNIIFLSDQKLGVEEACSGLSMLIVFFALSTATVLVTRRPWLDRVAILASAIPIAVIANVTRIVVTAMLMRVGKTEAARVVFHDVAGWLMILLALALLKAELGILSRLLRAYEPTMAKPLVLAGIPRRRDAGPADEKRKRAGRSGRPAAVPPPPKPRHGVSRI
jgi:exosortase